MILQSPLRTAIRTQMPGFVSFMLKKIDIFKNQDKIKKVTDYPVFFIHGRKDNVVPFAHGEYLYKECINVNQFVVEPFWVDNCGHNDIEYYRGMDLLDKLHYFIHQTVTLHYTKRDTQTQQSQQSQSNSMQNMETEQKEEESANIGIFTT